MLVPYVDGQVFMQSVKKMPLLFIDDFSCFINIFLPFQGSVAAVIRPPVHCRLLMSDQGVTRRPALFSEFAEF